MGKESNPVTTQITLQCILFTLTIILLRLSVSKMVYPWLRQCRCALYVLNGRVMDKLLFIKNWMDTLRSSSTSSLFVGYAQEFAVK